MNSTGCGFLVLAALALLAGLVPFLEWTNLVITLPLVVLGVITTATQARKPAAQSADKAMFALALGLALILAARVAAM